MIFKRKKVIQEKLLNAFGQIKEDAFNFDLIEKYSKSKALSGNFQKLSDKTCNDLDFDELFMFADRTNSRIGQQYLYHKLRNIPLFNSDQSKDERIIHDLKENVAFRLNVQTQLSKLNDFNVYYLTTLFQDNLIKPPKWFFIVPVLSFTCVLSLLFMLFNIQFAFVLIGLLIPNLLIHYWNKKNLDIYLNSLPQLLKLKSITSKLFVYKQLTQINPKLTDSIKTVNSIRRKVMFFTIESNMQGEFQAFLWLVLELIKIMFLFEPILLFSSLKKLEDKRSEIEQLFNFVGHVDYLNSIASFRAGLKQYCIPEITKDKSMDAENVYHPLIIDCVDNTIQVNDKSILITGSNMSGKTSFIRTVGINVLFGLCLNTCFAKQFKLPIMQVFSAIRISDDLMNDKSYYFEEVLTIKQMIDESKSNIPNLFLLDELFKGTNTVERISAGKAVLSNLNDHGNIVFVSTHDIELADLLKNEYELYHFSERIDQNTIDFDYKLKDGKLKKRNAIKILQINNYPDTIIQEAHEISSYLDNITQLNTLKTYEN